MMNKEFSPVEWSLNTNIYEVNVRQYTPEGTFRAFQKHLPRLREMGVETLWFMPITPIATEKRHGTLGSYYACSSYDTINPEFGTLDDFKDLVQEAHDRGFKVIIDWVANHTGWNHEWTVTNPGFYKKNTEGSFYDTHGWEDVIDLNFYDHNMRREMVAAMKYWLQTCDLDGFRCDMAHIVPHDFWRNTRLELDAIKPLFWLAESDDPNYYDVFDVGYAWQWMHRTESFFKKETSLRDMNLVLKIYDEQYPRGSRHLFFTTNHDENSWNGTEFEKYGDAARGLAVFTYTWNGVPLVYSGQEIPNTKRLKFFDKDQLDFGTSFKNHDFYKTLNQFRKEHPAFTGYPLTSPDMVPTNHPDKVTCYHKRAGDADMLVAINLSPETISVEIASGLVTGDFRSVLDTRTFNFDGSIRIECGPWDALVLTNHKH